jgi:hypothetical protein
MSIPLHQKYLSCDIKFTDGIFRSIYKKPTNMSTGGQFRVKKLASTQNIVPISKMLDSSPIYKVNRGYTKLITSKLPKVGYLVTNLKAPHAGTITASIKEKLNKGRLHKLHSKEEIEKAMKEQREARRRKSIELLESCLNDSEEKFEDIMNSDPHKVLQDRKEGTIYQKANRLINVERGRSTQFDDYEDETIRKQVEIANVKSELQEIQNTQNTEATYSDEVLGTLHRQVQTKKTRENKYYRFVKDPRTQLMQKKILSTSDCSIFSKLYLLNKNPLLEINEMISLPYILTDSDLLANVHHVNMYKMKNMKDKYIKN